MHNVSASDSHAVESGPVRSFEGQRQAHSRVRSRRRGKTGPMRRAGGYGSLAVSAWLLTAVATGHGVAAADGSPSNSSSTTTNSETSSPGKSDTGSTANSSSRPKRTTPGTSDTDAATASTDSADAADDTSPHDAESGSSGGSAGKPESSVSETAPGEDVDTTEEDPSPVDIDTPTLRDGSSTPVTPQAPEVSETPQGEYEDPSIPSPSGDGAAHPGPVTSGSSTSGNDRPRNRDSAGKISPAETASSPVSPRPRPTRYSTPVDGASESKDATKSPNAPTDETGVPSAAAPNVVTAGQQTTPTTARALPRPFEVIAEAVNAVIGVIFSPFMTSLPEAPAGQNPFAWAVLAFVRRNFFNESPTITSVNLGQQQANGTITGYIDAVDPDELGKTVTVKANVYAAPAQPRVSEPGCGCATVDGVQGIPFTNAASLGTAPGSTWYAPDAVDNTCVYIGADGRVTYTGTETGEVTIDGLGTGDLTLVFEGLLLSATEERSVAQLQSHLGTGDLKGVKGTVISESTLDATGAATGVLTGEVVRPELRYKIAKQATHGTVVLDEISGQFTYTPDPAFADQGGDDSFQIVVTDNRFSLLKLFERHNGDPVHTVNLSVASSAPAANFQV